MSFYFKMSPEQLLRLVVREISQFKNRAFFQFSQKKGEHFGWCQTGGGGPIWIEHDKKKLILILPFCVYDWGGIN